MQENVNSNGNSYEQKLLLEGKKRLSMTGIEAVDGFSEQVLKLSINGTRVFICGENIKITSYNKADGSLSADGDFSEIKYNYKKAPLIKRLFK